MKNAFIFSEEIKNELREIEDIVTTLIERLSLISQKIKYLILLIKSCQTVQEALPYFSILDDIQLVLARLVFEKNINISAQLRNFITDFDNLDLNRESLFKQIKADKYFFNS
jgi:hypothetical protein